MKKLRLSLIALLAVIAGVISLASPAYATFPQGAAQRNYSPMGTWDGVCCYQIGLSKPASGNSYQVLTYPAYSATPEEFLYWQDDGNLVIYSNYGTGSYHATWQSGTYNQGASSLNFQADGNVVIYRSDGYPLWQSGTANGSSYKGFIGFMYGNGAVEIGYYDSLGWRHDQVSLG